MNECGSFIAYHMVEGVPKTFSSFKATKILKINKNTYVYDSVGREVSKAFSKRTQEHTFVQVSRFLSTQTGGSQWQTPEYSIHSFSRSISRLRVKIHTSYLFRTAQPENLPCDSPYGNMEISRRYPSTRTQQMSSDLVSRGLEYKGNINESQGHKANVRTGSPDSTMARYMLQHLEWLKKSKGWTKL